MRWMKRVGWFGLLWLVSVVAVGIVAFAIRTAIV